MGGIVNNIFKDIENLQLIQTVDTYLIDQVSKLTEKANEQKASQTRKPTLSIEETRKRIGEKMVDSSEQKAEFGV
tara:strand:- start:827 stop:1051 length:225 start_codon:yes stop_codon:yes gene_type:complete